MSDKIRIRHPVTGKDRYVLQGDEVIDLKVGDHKHDFPDESTFAICRICGRTRHTTNQDKKGEENDVQ